MSELAVVASIRALVTVFAMAIIAGCNNKPGALTMTVQSEKTVYSPHEPVALKVTTRSKEGTQCLWRNHGFTLNANREYGQRLSGEKAYWICGTPFASMLPFLPLINCYRALDSADTLDQFVTVTPEKHESRTVWLIAGCNSSSIRYYDWDESISKSPPEMPVHWSPGRYSVTVSLDNPVSSIYRPAPLGWTPYSHPVSATAEFEIESP